MHQEQQYLDLVADVINNGEERNDRTGVGTLAKFGARLEFNLEHEFPLLTTKKVFWRAVVEELLWFISGSTDATVLQKKRIHIWDANSGNRDDRDQNDLGPIYGFQWRHFGATYIDCKTDYSGQGVDQLANVIAAIKNNPTDRRMIISSWNPVDLPQMALPPCHAFTQFYVSNDGRLSCQLYQRSCDLGLGVPFNIASYSLLTYMIAHLTGLKPGKFIHVMGDAHVYKNHVAVLTEQIQRKPTPLPKLTISVNRSNPINVIDSFVYEDFILTDYNPHPPLKMDMAG